MTDNIEQLKRDIKTQKLQIKALLVHNPKELDQSVFLGEDESLIHAFVNSFGEAWLSPAPREDCLCDDDAWTTSTDYPAGKKVGSGYDPRGWQRSLIVRQQEELAFVETPCCVKSYDRINGGEWRTTSVAPIPKTKTVYDRAINLYTAVFGR